MVYGIGRAHVFSEVGIAGRYWVYEIRDMARPIGVQVLHGGVRMTWRDALSAAHDTLSHEGPWSTA